MGKSFEVTRLLDYCVGGGVSRVIRARYENGVLRPLEPVDLREGEEVLVVVKEDLVEFARRIRRTIGGRGEEPSEVLSRERGRFCVEER